MDSATPIVKAVEIRCQDKFGNVIDEFRLSDFHRQNQVRIEGNMVFVAENYSDSIVLDIIPKGDKYEKKQIEFRLENVEEDVYTVVLELVQYKVVFRVGNSEFDTTDTMNPSAVRTKWGAYDYEINNNNRTVYIKVHGKPVEKVSREPIQTVVERQSILRSIGKRFRGKRKWLLLLIMSLLGYGIYACVSKFAYEKTPWPFKVSSPKIENQFDDLFEDQDEDLIEVQAEEEITLPDGKETPSSVVSETVKVADSDHQHDIDYLNREKKWDFDSLRTPEYRALYDAMKEGDIDQVIQLKNTLFDSAHIQSDFRKIVYGLNKFKEANDQKKLKMSKDEMMRLCKRGSFEIGELGYSISIIDKRN